MRRELRERNTLGHLVHRLGLATLGLLLLGALGATIAPQAAAQQIVGRIDLDDADPNSVPDSPYGQTISPDGQYLIVCIAGDPDFSPDPPDLNNREVRIIDRDTDTVVNVIQTGLFPIECAVTENAGDAWLWVSNSSSDSVSVFRVAGGAFENPGAITEETFSPIDTGAFSFPNHLVATEDDATLFVGTTGGTGDVLVIDSDPVSGTFGQVVDMVTLVGSVGRMAIHDGDLVAPQSNFAFPLSDGRISIVDTTDLSNVTTLRVTPTFDFNDGDFVSVVDVAISPEGKAYATILGPGTGNDLVVVDVASRSISSTIDLTGIASEEAHGIGIAPDGRYAIVTVFQTQELVVLDLEDDSVLTVIPSPDDEPNEVVWSLDSCTAYVTNQDSDASAGDSITVLARFPDRDLRLTGDTTPSIGGSLDLAIAGGCEGRKCGILTSLSNDGGAFRGIPVPLGGPISVVQGGRLGIAGDFAAQTIDVPSDPALIGATRYYLAGTNDPGGVIRLSNLHAVIYQP